MAAFLQEISRSPLSGCAIRSIDDYSPVFFNMKGYCLSPLFASYQLVAKMNRHPFWGDLKIMKTGL